MAETLLGLELRHPRRRHRPRLPAPRERGGADVRRRAAGRWPACGCTTACSRRPRARRWPSRSATSAAWRRCSTSVGREALVLYFSSGHYRQPIAFSPRALEAAPRRRGGSARRGGGCDEGDSPDALAGSATRSSTRWPTTSTPPRRCRRCTTGSARQRRRRRRRRAPARDARRARARAPAGGRRGAPPEVQELAERRDAARARDRDWAEADRLRDELRAMGWEVRDGPQDRSSSRRLTRRPPARVPRRAGHGRLRPQPGPRGAARAAAACTGSGRPTARRATGCAARPVDGRRRRGDRGAVRVGRPPGRLRRGRPVSVRRRRRAARARPTR